MNLNLSLNRWLAVNSIGKKPRTVRYHQELAGMIRKHWTHADSILDTLSADDWTAFALSIGHYSATRYNAAVSILHSLCQAARSIPRRPVAMRERPLLNQLEFSALLAALDSRPRSHGGLVVRFLAYTGLRINEARLLRWSDVRENHLLIPGAFTKNGKPKAVPFIGEFPDVLNRLRAISPNLTILPQKNCRTALRTACQIAGVPRLSHHDFRHLFATRCIESGVDIPTTALWLGHSDRGITLSRCYFHLLTAHSTKMAGRVKF